MRPDLASPAERIYLDLVARYQGAILNYVHRLVGDIDVAEELVQDTFVKAYRALERLDLDSDKDPLRRAWLYRIAQNTATDHLRRRARLRWLSWDALTGADLGDRSAPDPADAPAEREPVRRALASLDEAGRQVLLLFNQEGLSAEEVGEVLGISEVAARKRRQRATGAFRKAYLDLAGQAPDEDGAADHPAAHEDNASASKAKGRP